ncbi:MAG: MATE family efflux transporter, partial [Porphyromonadaceae bacterium]|nr:MATE family efflux transporter [Porphyromonadaceae bacterium]
LGMVDIAIAGHLSSPLYIGAIALGGAIFSMIYWNFNFLRMGTSGFTAQAYGARDFTEMIGNLVRSLLVAISIGLLIVFLKHPIFSLARLFIQSGSETQEFVGIYFHTAVWSAPAMLGMYALNGWLIGMQNARTPMYIAVFNNLLNIILSFSFVYGLGMQIEGIALGTMLSQWISFLAMGALIRKKYGRLRRYFNRKGTFRSSAFKDFFRVNTDIFIRTFLLVLVTAFFTFASSGMGDTLLAVNSLLMQFFMLFSYFMDGFAYAGEALTGRFVGARSPLQLKKLIRHLFTWGVILAGITTLIYALFTPEILRILTDKSDIIKTAQSYLLWTALIPFAGFSSFIWDGIYVGATASKPMRNSMIIAALVFFICFYSLVNLFSNNALWLSFILYLLFRGIMQTVFFFGKKSAFIPEEKG